MHLCSIVSCVLTPQLVREARLRAGLTQTELGARIRRSQSEIARWERGQVTPSLETVRRVVRACGLDLTLGIANADDSYAPHLDRALALTPAERVSEGVRRSRAAQRMRGKARARRG